ncbi:MAG: VOC family protein [Eubacteriales bacterium]|nr:VOC family protein [Eubacteriales bacterium]
MRSKFQLYLKGCDEAIELYKKAFDATVNAIYRNSENTAILHAEIDVFGQCLAFMDTDNESITGNTMEISFEECNEEIMKKAYEVLKDGAKIEIPLGPYDWTSCLFALTDKFGVNWLLYI